MVTDPDIHKANSTGLQTSTTSIAHSQQERASYVTLEPFTPTSKGRGRGTNRGRNITYRKPHQTLSEQLLANSSNQTEYKKYYIMKATSDINLWKTTDTIQANRELEKYLKGSPKKVTELKNGSLLIEVNSKEQATKIKQITNLTNINVIVQEHSTLNYTKGTIRCTRFVDVSEDILIEELNQYKVTEVYKIKRKQQNELINTGTMILTFDRCTLPSNIKIGWKSYEVREYIPAPRRCFKCQGFNHSSKACHAAQAICVNCGELEHGKECRSPPHCVNCEEAHPASDRNCFYYKMEGEILSTKTKEKVSYGEAKRIVNKRFVKPATSYAQALKANTTIIQDSNKTLPHYANKSNNPIANDSQLLKAQQEKDRQYILQVLKANKDSKLLQPSNENNKANNTALQSIPTIVTSNTNNNNKEDLNAKKRTIEESNTKVVQSKMAKVHTTPNRAEGSGHAGGGPVPPSPAPPPSHPQPPPQQLHHRMVATAGASASGGKPPQLSTETDMDYNSPITPSPIIGKPPRGRSKSRDRYNNNNKDKQDFRDRQMH